MLSGNFNPSETFSTLIAMCDLTAKIYDAARKVTQASSNVIRQAISENKNLIISVALFNLLPKAIATYSASISADETNSSFLFCWQDHSLYNVGGLRVTDNNHNGNFAATLENYNELYDCNLPASGGFTMEDIPKVDSCFRHGLTLFEVVASGEAKALVQEAGQECYEKLGLGS